MWLVAIILDSAGIDNKRKRRIQKLLICLRSIIGNFFKIMFLFCIH